MSAPVASHTEEAGRLRREIESLGPWFHNLHLPNGLQTAPGHFLGDFPTNKWREVAPSVPDDLSGWTVLDIGCNAGFYSIELARRGASVTALDVDERYLRQARWAARQYALESRIELRHAHAYELLREQRTYDLVWFTGLFYHLRYPLIALDLVRRVTARLMMFQSLTMPGGTTDPVPTDLPIDGRELMLKPNWPKMAFIEHRVAADPTNWWAPNHPCVEALLRSAGFRVLERPTHEFYLCEPVAAGPPRDLEALCALLMPP